MGRIPQDELERLKRETALEALVRAYGVELKQRGGDYVGRCPFHGPDEAPSFVVTPEKGLFHCFGCGAGGDVFAFVMRTHGVSFRHAVELVREGAASSAAGLPPRNRSHVRRLPSPVELDASDHELLDQVVGYYHETLERSPEALEYLRKRGVDDPEALEGLEVGFADRTLGLRLPTRTRKAGVEIRDRLERLGILRGSGHEHLVGRVTFPMRDERGHVGEVYGRKLEHHTLERSPAHLYLPGPHRGVFNLAAFQDAKELIVTEAVFDALSFWVAGFRNVTASFGANGFTQEMLEATRAYGVERVLIAYDRDEQGDTAAKALATTLAGEGIASFRVLFPRGLDANEYALKVTPASRSLAVLLRSAEWMAGPVNAHGAPNRPPEPAPPPGSRCSVVGCRTRPPDQGLPPPSLEPPEVPGAATPAPSPEPSPPLAAEPPSLRPGTPPPADGHPATNNQQPATLPASPLLPAPSLDVPAEVGEAEVVITLGDRRWRARGLERCTSYDLLRVNLLVARAGGDAFHVDTLDLYAHRQRQAFLKQAAAELKVDGELLKQDLGKVFFKLEQLLDERMKATLAPKERPAVTLSEEERARALELLKDPKLLDRIKADFHAFGVVGEETNTLTGYLVAVSRKLTRPLALLLQSSSAAGKSELMGAILAFTPPEERVAYSAMTGQSLFYMGETDLKHKVLAIAEEEGAEKASYALKLLQSEGKLSIASAGKDPSTGRHVTHCYHVEGPAAIMLTTTSVDLDEELQSRCVVLAVDEGREQTRAIHRLQRERRTLEGLLASRKRERILKLHHDAQRLLKPIPVVVPHVRRLTFLDTKTRTRRDHDKYLTLVETVALLHQHQRPLARATTEDGEEVEYLEATLEDVAVASGLATEVLGRTLDELPPQSRRFLELLYEMVSTLCREKGVEQPDCLLGRRQILDSTGWSLRQVRRHIDRLVELEYVLPHRAANGQGLVYELLWDGKGRQGEPFVIGLADLDKLRSLEPTATAAPPSEATLALHLPPACPPVASPVPPPTSQTNPSSPRRLQPAASPAVEISRLRDAQQPALHVASGGGKAAPSLAAAARAAGPRAAGPPSPAARAAEEG